MKKRFFTLLLALLSAFSVNADEVTIDLSKYTPIGDTATNISAFLSNDVLTVFYDIVNSWNIGGVVFALDSLDVTNIAFDYKGDAAATEWVSFQVYLTDSKGGMWYSAAANLCISSINNAGWQSVSYMPGDVLWGIISWVRFRLTTYCQ